MLEFLKNPYFLGIAALCGIAGFIIQVSQILSRKLRKSDSHSPSSINKRVLSTFVGFFLASVCLLLVASYFLYAESSNLEKHGFEPTNHLLFDMEFIIGFIFYIEFPIGLPGCIIGWAASEEIEEKWIVYFGYGVVLFYLLLLLIGPVWNVKNPVGLSPYAEKVLLKPFWGLDLLAILLISFFYGCITYIIHNPKKAIKQILGRK